MNRASRPFEVRRTLLTLGWCNTAFLLVAAPKLLAAFRGVPLDSLTVASSLVGGVGVVLLLFVAASDRLQEAQRTKAGRALLAAFFVSHAIFFLILASG